MAVERQNRGLSMTISIASHRGKISPPCSRDRRAWPLLEDNLAGRPGVSGIFAGSAIFTTAGDTTSNYVAAARED